MSFILFCFIILLSECCISLQVCKYGDCNLSPSFNGEDIICTNTAKSCTISCSQDQCELSSMYLAASESNSVYCDGDRSCDKAHIYCGIPPMDEGKYPTNYSSNDFSGNINLCRFEFVNKAAFDAGTRTTVQCNGNINECFLRAYAGDTNFKEADFTCNINGSCTIQCDDNKGCGDDKSNFICNSPLCNCTGDGCEKLIVITPIPTVNPTNYPTINPTLYPSINPNNFPSLNPTYVPSSNPTNYPSTNPTNLPSISPTESNKYPTNLPSINPTNYVINTVSSLSSTSSSSSSSLTSINDDISSTSNEGEIRTTANTLNDNTEDINNNENNQQESGTDDSVTYIIIGSIVSICCLSILCVFILYKKKYSSTKKEKNSQYIRKQNSNNIFVPKSNMKQIQSFSPTISNIIPDDDINTTTINTNNNESRFVQHLSNDTAISDVVMDDIINDMSTPTGDNNYYSPAQVEHIKQNSSKTVKYNYNNDDDESIELDDIIASFNDTPMGDTPIGDNIEQDGEIMEFGTRISVNTTTTDDGIELVGSGKKYNALFSVAHK